MKTKYTRENLELIVKECYSIRQVLQKLGLKEAGGNYENIKTRINQYGIDMSHFHGQVWNKGKTWSKIKDISDKLVENSTYSSGLPYSSNKLKKFLLKLEIMEPICMKCELRTWLDFPIPLELHHVNGNRFDNRIKNLQLLCPNCHSFTDNYRGKNMSARGESL